MMEGLHSEFERIRRKFCHFENFGPKNRFFGYRRSVHACSLLIGTLAGEKICIFWFFMVIYTCSAIAEAFHQVLDGQQAQKHHENHLVATFCHSRKFLWANASLRGKMSFKFKNSTWVGK